MLYRPRFCANCGEAIERPDWHIWTSRRFCQVCESEYKGQDLIPRAIVIASLLVGVIGLGGYFSGGRPNGDQARVRRQLRSDTAPQAAPASENTLPASRTLVSAANNDVTAAKPATQAEQAPVKSMQPIAKVEQTYYCGAETKKGTPCMRHVKGNVRCYQHQGMPAMLSADRLKIQ